MSRRSPNQFPHIYAVMAQKSMRHLRDPVFAADWVSMFSERPASSLSSYEILEIEGILPSNLTGTFFRNGPGTFNRSAVSASVDGDGMLSRITFTGGSNNRVYFRNQMIETEGYMEEQAAGRAIHRGPFGSVPDHIEDFSWITKWTGLLLRGWFTNSSYKNTSNTSQVVLNRNQMLTFWEGGLPHLINPTTMETIGPMSFNNILEPKRPFSAHPEIDNNVLINFGINYGRTTNLSIWEIDLAKESKSCNKTNNNHSQPSQPSQPPLQQHQLLQVHSVTLRSMGASIHDCSITKNWIIVCHDPVKFNYFKLISGYSLDEWLGDDTSATAKTHIYLFPRHKSSTKPGSIKNTTEKNRKCFCLYKIPPSFSHHHVQAFEDSNGNIVLDRIAYVTRPPLLMESIQEQSSLGNAAGPGQLQRITLKEPIEWGTQRGEDTNTIEILSCSPISCEMAVVNTDGITDGIDGSRNFIYSIDTCSQYGPWTGLNKSDVKNGTNLTWRPHQKRTFLGEPVFVSPRNDNDEKEEKETEKETEKEEEYSPIKDALWGKKPWDERPKRNRKKRKEHKKEPKEKLPKVLTEDEGYLLCLGFHAEEKRSSIYVLNAKTMKEIARVRLRSFIPFSHHCSWTPEVFLEGKERTDAVTRNDSANTLQQKRTTSAIGNYSTSKL